MRQSHDTVRTKSHKKKRKKKRKIKKKREKKSACANSKPLDFFQHSHYRYNVTKKKPGRPSRYNKLFHPKLAAAYAAHGLTNDQIADELGIVRSTFYKWLIDHPAISDAMKKAKEDPDDNVERSLFERANGYTHNEEKIFYDSQRGEVVRAATKKHYPPDTAAAFIWLKNRRPAKWRDKQEVVHSTPDGKPIIQIYIPDNGRKADG